MMTGRHFQEWLDTMDISAAEAARLLGVKPNSITRYKKQGGPEMLRLACQWLDKRRRIRTREIELRAEKAARAAKLGQATKNRS